MLFASFTLIFWNRGVVEACTLLSFTQIIFHFFSRQCPFVSFCICATRWCTRRNEAFRVAMAQSNCVKWGLGDGCLELCAWQLVPCFWDCEKSLECWAGSWMLNIAHHCISSTNGVHLITAFHPSFVREWVPVDLTKSKNFISLCWSGGCSERNETKKLRNKPLPRRFYYPAVVVWIPIEC